jgi:hypothetical protein
MRQLPPRKEASLNPIPEEFWDIVFQSGVELAMAGIRFGGEWFEKYRKDRPARRDLLAELREKRENRAIEAVFTAFEKKISRGCR